MPAAILCEDLFKRYENKKLSVDAVNGLHLKVEKGQCFGLLGPNGAGKTTTVEILEGILKPTSGRVEVLGESWGRGRDHQLRQRIGVTLQETRFQEKLSIREVLTLFRSFYEDGLMIGQALEQVSLQEKEKAWVRQLSGGQKQRLAVATALVGDPELLFLDEPTTGLDPQARRQIWEVVTRLKERGRTILLTTHYMDEAEKLCDDLTVVDHGKVIAEGSPQELIAQLGGGHVIDVSLEGQEDLWPSKEELLAIDSVTHVIREGKAYLLNVEQPHRAIPSLLSWLASRGLDLGRLSTRHANLEDVFVSLTGRHLRDV